MLHTSDTQSFHVFAGACSGCGGCVDLQPDYVRLEDERPVLLTSQAPEDVIQELVSICPEECFEFGD